ncbi:MAG: gliding motility-associated C-terminal domain-containing protein [Prevotella sp.]|nr:gliding motility-associated C-terminal domain-containing protein [Prevotella sp.]
MNIRHTLLVATAWLWPLLSTAQTDYPMVSPTATYTDSEGVENTVSDAIDEQAPLTVTFAANPSNMEGLNPTYAWHFRREGESRDLMVRYEEQTEYTFNDSGTTNVILKTTLAGGEELDSVVISVTISESKLTFPNAFSPNGDEYNEVFKAKEHQSLTEFHAYIFNRWGQKLFEWTDPAGGWDGTYHGKPVKDGTYFLRCKARGADGRDYDIRRDVNLLRGYIEGYSTAEE